MRYTNGYLEVLSKTNRYLTMLRRRNHKLRHLIPRRFIRNINRSKYYLSHLKTFCIPAIYKSSNTNIYHCCVQKTGSQWIKSVLTDLMTYRYSGLTYYPYQIIMLDGYDPRAITERSFTEPFPINKIITPLYIDYNNYANIKKLGPHKAFFVMRDPRDIVVSWYFSTKSSHVLLGGSAMYLRRQELHKLSFRDGMIYGIEYLHNAGHFTALRSWAEAARNESNVLLVRYEDLVASSFTVFKKLFADLDIQMPDAILADLIQAYSFKRLSGRDQGKENQQSHLRKGIAGDWRNHFDNEITAVFHKFTGDLVHCLGYT